MVIRSIIAGIIVATIVLPGWATKISNVKVDFIKGYDKSIVNTSDTAYDYMGRLTYTFLAESNDSTVVDFVITDQSTQTATVLLEKTGDIGLVKQNNPGDTLKTIFFRTQLVGDIAGNYVATVTANANLSRMWKLADSIVRQMSVDQRMYTLYNAADKQWFGADNLTLSNGKFVVGWRCSDGPHGVRWPIGPSDDSLGIYGAGNPATVFPTEVALASTFDTALLYRVGWAIARETRANGLYCNLGPMCDLVVNSRWGRTFETMGEDPVLSGKMVASRILGTESEHVIATPKHFSPYLMEQYRVGGLRVVVSERAFRELFCVPFEMAVTVGGAHGLMTCYNKVKIPGFTTSNQSLLNQNCDLAGTNKHLINDILRHDWGFKGIIMTDWGALSNATNGIYTYDTADFDMSTPYGNGGYSSINTNIANGILDSAPLIKKATDVMYGKLWAWGGTLLPSESAINSYATNPILNADHLAIALEAARKSIVLAKNNPVGGSPILPLDTNGTFKIAVVGPYANIAREEGGGSSYVTPDTIITPLGAIKSIIAGHPHISLVSDYHSADIAVVVIGTLEGLNGGESESADRPNLSLSSDQLALVTSVMSAVSKTIVIYTGGSASVAGSWSNAPAVVIALNGGRSHAQAVSEVLFSITNPSGHLSLTWPYVESDLPAYTLNTSTLEFNVQTADTAHGYFYFEKTGKTPLFWFGHGLSYTTFTFNSISVKGPPIITAGDRIDLRVNLSNTGTRNGDAVVQLYVRPTAIAVPHRVKDLRGFKRVTLAVGQTSTVSFTLGSRDFSTYLADSVHQTGQWKANPGTYDIIAGSTSNPAELVNGNGKCVITSITVQ